jgi:hypothetical protein
MHMLPHAFPAIRVHSCLRKGECEIFRRSVVPILHKDWHRECSLFRFLNLRVSLSYFMPPFCETDSLSKKVGVFCE